ncbi:cobyrinate a,c-diamide synthase [Candidatus Synechococcus calcipolaris G9]|uniref:Cobyrinate a,c-diamide synthase n=1 Tax=Candidatus Synechococcus calcipolaris G9 TaxID=1497997 RepID=A0ABT6EWC4_9SYNE|nr:cobyrinate a,c-diamide synthase [Candidatus Synechococcus calcipolaris]MDG2990074.1 cobyrinate a,c-diamide synthase [Candidatus Synechococcus calcipolaris G9]
MALIIAGERSGVGKTTIALALNAALRAWGESVQVFKVGPDYIDPMFHSRISGQPCRNLDPILTSPAYVQACFQSHCQGATYSLIEGVMGLFDGRGGTQAGSTADIARILNLPILLVIDAQKLAGSVAAIAQGFVQFDPKLTIAGLILNRVGSDRHQAILQTALEPLDIPIVGWLRREDAIQLHHRHLGLIPLGEMSDFNALGDRLAHLGQTCFDWSILRPLLADSKSSSSLPTGEPLPENNLPQKTPRVSLAIAQDEAFNFYYADNLDLLTALGTTLVPWSPIRDTHLPPNIGGLYFGGGFPEVFAPDLSENESARRAVAQAIQKGMPTYAECGGLMYLSEAIIPEAGKSYPMVGVLPTQAHMGQRLTLGYRHVTAIQPSPLVPLETRLWGHEFHYSRLTPEPDCPLWHIDEDNHNPLPSAHEGWFSPTLHASYIHLHWGTHPDLLARFLGKIYSYRLLP